jgi:hypothetical protein
MLKIRLLKWEGCFWRTVLVMISCQLLLKTVVYLQYSTTAAEKQVISLLKINTVSPPPSLAYLITFSCLDYIATNIRMIYEQ